MGDVEELGLRHTREFVRLIDGVEKQTEGLTSQAFAELIKPCVDDNADKCKDCLTRRVMSIGDTVGWKKNGDSKHYGKRTGSF